MENWEKWWNTDIFSDNTKRKELGLDSLDDAIAKIEEGLVTDIYDSISTSVASGSGGLTGNMTISAANEHPDFYVENNAEIKGSLTVDGMDVGATLKTLQERFLILEADFEKHEQYPALKDAYEKYKLIEKLLMDNAKNDK